MQRVAYRSFGQGLDTEHPAMRLFQKAKKLGTWDPYDVDLTKDREDWARLSKDERDVLLLLTSMFQAGEEAVTLDLIPLVEAVAADGRLEEEIYLTSFLWEESKHVETFHRYLHEVMQDDGDLNRYLTPSYRRIFDEELPRSMGRLREDRSPEALAEASVTYNMIVEGVLAETGYHSYYSILEREDLLPGMRQLVRLTKLDESRHIAYGVFLLSRLVAEFGEPVWNRIEARLNELISVAVNIIPEGLGRYDPIPFGVTIEEFVTYAMTQFQARYSRIQQSQGQTLEDILRREMTVEDA